MSRRTWRRSGTKKFIFPFRTVFRFPPFINIIFSSGLLLIINTVSFSMGNTVSTPVPGGSTAGNTPSSTSPSNPHNPPVSPIHNSFSRNSSSSSSSDSVCPVVHVPASTTSGGSGTAACPVIKEGSGTKNVIASIVANNAAASSASSSTSSSKPTTHKQRGPVYNVYGQEIDPTNMMPPPNQAPSPGQRMPLSTDRVQSTIKKGGTDSTWLYPSSQMFWNALVRKGKADGVHESDVDIVIQIHNEMNERAWKQLLTWEENHKTEHLEGEPALRRFQGNPYQLSPKAQLRAFLGYGYPFDRHDWFVDRGGKLKHYIIDYFYNPKGNALADQPESFDGDAKYTRTIFVDVRPAIESAGDVYDRLMRFPERTLAAFRRPRFWAEGIDPSMHPKDEKSAGYSSDKHSENATNSNSTNTPSKIRSPAPVSADGINWDIIDNKCGPLLESLKSAKTEDDRRSTSLAFNYCMGRQLCPTEANKFMTILENNTHSGKEGEAGGDEEQAFEAMTKCIAGKVAGRSRDLGTASATSPKLQ